VFIPDFVRVGSFVYEGIGLTTYDSLLMTLRQLNPNLMLNQIGNPDSIIYDTQISGAGFLRHMVKIADIAPKGHFY
jgi:hypothetical protein